MAFKSTVQKIVVALKLSATQQPQVQKKLSATQQPQAAGDGAQQQQMKEQVANFLMPDELALEQKKNYEELEPLIQYQLMIRRSDKFKRLPVSTPKFKKQESKGREHYLMDGEKILENYEYKIHDHIHIRSPNFQKTDANQIIRQGSYVRVLKYTESTEVQEQGQGESITEVEVLSGNQIWMLGEVTWYEGKVEVSTEELKSAILQWGYQEKQTLKEKQLGRAIVDEVSRTKSERQEIIRLYKKLKFMD